MTTLTPHCRNCALWLPVEPNRGICRMGHAPEPLVWLKFRIRDGEGTLHSREIQKPELLTDPAFGCCLFEPFEELEELRRLEEELRDEEP